MSVSPSTGRACRSARGQRDRTAPGVSKRIQFDASLGRRGAAERNHSTKPHVRSPTIAVRQSLRMLRHIRRGPAVYGRADSCTGRGTVRRSAGSTRTNGTAQHPHRFGAKIAAFGEAEGLIEGALSRFVVGDQHRLPDVLRSVSGQLRAARGRHLISARPDSRGCPARDRSSRRPDRTGQPDQAAAGSPGHDNGRRSPDGAGEYVGSGCRRSSPQTRTAPAPRSRS